MTDSTTLDFDTFMQVDIRIGTIVEADPLEGARKPALRLAIEFGPELGRRQSSAQLTRHYEPEDLVGRQVLAVVNFPPRRIAGFRSEVLVVGVPDEDGEPVLISAEKKVPDGGRLF